jgi:hypothetical protein
LFQILGIISVRGFAGRDSDVSDTPNLFVNAIFISNQPASLEVRVFRPARFDKPFAAATDKANQHSVRNLIPLARAITHPQGVNSFLV